MVEVLRIRETVDRIRRIGHIESLFLFRKFLVILVVCARQATKGNAESLKVACLCHVESHYLQVCDQNCGRDNLRWCSRLKFEIAGRWQSIPAK